MSNSNMDMTNDVIFRLGMEAGRKQLADHIQHQFEIGKPAEINGNLYWMKDTRQNLQDIMDDIESSWNERHEVKKFVVPIKKRSFNNEEIIREVIIQADTAEMARVIAIRDFQHDNGWAVDMDCGNYRMFKG